MITVLAGGTGSVKLVRGLALQTRDLTIVSNVGDNIWLHGLYICPDIDTITYGLAALLDQRQGWGIRNDSYGFLSQMEMLGEHIWFKLGDRDLATHLLRTNMLKKGKSLAQITEWMRNKYTISAKIIPATEYPIETKILTDKGEMHIQEFWVKHKGEPKVMGIKYDGVDKARTHPQVIQALRRSKLIIIAPANPITSIGPIIAVKSLEKVLIKEKNKIIAVSPLIGHEPISGPAGKYMKAIGLPTSPFGIAQYYSKFITKFVISRSDNWFSKRIHRLGIKVYQTNIMMDNGYDEIRLASFLLSLLKGF